LVAELGWHALPFEVVANCLVAEPALCERIRTPLGEACVVHQPRAREHVERVRTRGGRDRRGLQALRQTL